MNSDVTAVAARSLPSTATLSPGKGGQPRLLIDAPAGSAEIYLHGAHVTSWMPRGSQEVLFVSREAIFDGVKAIRGGIPLCLPWFGSGIDGVTKPAHGWARTNTWELRSVTETERGDVCALLGLDHDDLGLLYEVVLGPELSLTLTVRNLEKKPRLVEAALHAYLNLDDVTASEIHGLEGSTFFDAIENCIKTGENNPLQVIDAVDRVYQCAGDIRVSDPGHGRQLVIRRAQAPNTVVWNPWAEGVSGFADMADDEFTHMLCVEPGAVKENAVLLAPGESWTIRTTLSAESSAD